jgi:hypothetical protein
MCNDDVPAWVQELLEIKVVDVLPERSWQEVWAGAMLSSVVITDQSQILRLSHRLTSGCGRWPIGVVDASRNEWAHTGRNGESSDPPPRSGLVCVQVRDRGA